MSENIKILCVDYNPDLLREIACPLIREGHTVFATASARAASAMLRDNEVQVVVSSCDSHGLELLQEASILRPNSVRILIYEEKDSAAAIAAVNEGYIYKIMLRPWVHDDFILLIKRAVDHYSFLVKDSGYTSDLLESSETLKKLLAEKDQALEFTSFMLETSQDILYSLPVPVLGVALDGIIVQCNEAWAVETGDHWRCIGLEAAECLSQEMLDFIECVKKNQNCNASISVNNINGHIFGSLLKDRSRHVRGVILVFVKD